MTIEGRAVLVTGANRGIGRALVEEALRRGATRVYAGMRQPLTHADGRVSPFAMDVTDTAQIERAVGQVESLDILINNAGVALYDDLSEASDVRAAGEERDAAGDAGDPRSVSARRRSRMGPLRVTLCLLRCRSTSQVGPPTSIMQRRQAATTLATSCSPVGAATAMTSATCRGVTSSPRSRQPIRWPPRECLRSGDLGQGRMCQPVRAWSRDSARAVSKDAGIARLILVNGPPASGKSTLARRYVNDHDRAVLIEVDTLRMTLPNWEQDEATRLGARDLAGAAVIEHLGAGRDVVMAQYFGRLGYIVLLQDVAREHGATFVEVILATDAALAIDRFLARRRAMTERGEHHPERDIADADVEAFILDAVDRLARLPTARPESQIVPVPVEASEDEMYRRLLSVLGEKGPP